MTTDRIPNVVVEHPDGTVSFYCSRSNGPTRSRLNSAPSKPQFAFAPGDLVRVKGTIDEQLQLYGREVAGASGVIVQAARRSHGMLRYYVRFPSHDYVSPVRRQVSHIPELTAVLREEHIERVPADTESEATR